MYNNSQLKKNKVFYIQPILAGYRYPIIEKLATHFETQTFYDNTEAQKQGHLAVNSHLSTTVQSSSTPLLGGRLFYQKNIIINILRTKPDAIISFANPRFISLWLSMILSIPLNIKFYAHGQGLYAYKKPSLLRKIMYRSICKLSTKYVCYTELSRDSLIAAGCDANKLITIRNSLELQTTVAPNQKTYTENGILFIGRLRDGCRLDTLIKAIEITRNNGQLLELHIIGGGQLEDMYKNKNTNITWIHWHGPVHDNHRIAEISKSCRIGCYPGDAGLSVVHLFSLGLPPLIHKNIEAHMGPEPSYVRANGNGFLFDPAAGESGLSAILDSIWQLPAERMRDIAVSAYNTYLDLNNPTMGDQFVKLVLGNHCTLADAKP